MCEADVEIISPQDNDDLKGLHKLCMMHGREMAPSTVNERKVWEFLLGASENDAFTLLMAVTGNRAIGYLTLYEAGWWFGDEHFLCDMGFFVLPAFRSGEAGVQLLRVARSIAVQKKMQLRISITNPRRRRGRMNKEAEIVGFTPIGSTLVFGQPSPSILN